MTPKEYAGWLADKIPAYGDYAKEAALLLMRQADEIERLRGAMLMAASMLERDGDEHGFGYALRRALTPNVEFSGAAYSGLAGT